MGRPAEVDDHHPGGDRKQQQQPGVEHLWIASMAVAGGLLVWAGVQILLSRIKASECPCRERNSHSP
ncbi:MAG: hypothetical protein FJ078_09795 [Cyanobacteria bacterium K_DeepCast_35m_m2_155]|nr:hypothetical protein [Cyanobacteria bacterium K_DeepCast_35m_m2_155]